MLRAILLGIAIASLAACSPAVPKLAVDDGWARETGQSDAAAAYLTISNMGGADKLTGVRSSIGQAMLHESSMDGGVMRMRPIDPKEGLVVPSNGTLMLTPGGAHVMVMGLKKPLHAGDRFDVTLLFGKSGPRKVAITVKPANDAPASH
jgi:copper(I)-binding protein